MPTLTRGRAAALLALAALAACSDRSQSAPLLPTSPNAPGQGLIADGNSVRARGAGTVALTTNGRTTTRQLPAWTATGTLSGGLARQDAASASPMGALAVTKPNRLLLAGSAGVRWSSFTDDNANRVQVAWIFAPDGGPVRAVRMYVNGDLKMITDVNWSATRGIWTLGRITRRMYVNGAVHAAITVSASATEIASARGFPADALSKFAARVKKSLLPGDLEAQIFSGPCRMEWLEYTAATAALTAAVVAFERAPTPVTVSLMVAASAKATEAEFKLWICQQNALERGVGGSGSGAGGLGSGADLPPLGCLVETYSPSCDDGPGSAQ